MTSFFFKYGKYLVLLLLMYTPIFSHLDTLPIRIWDESRLAINAYEMFRNGNFIVTHFEGHPDMWNTKPPFLIWCQVFFMNIFGVNELAIRLPSAIAAMLTCGVLLFISLRFIKDFWFGFIAIVTLISFHGYIAIHSTRTGDYDALLTLFTTAGGFLFYLYCETKKNKHLYLFFLTIVFGVLTKSITGLLFMPAIFIYAIIQKQFVSIIKNKHFYIGFVSTLTTIIGYYLLREHYNEGYLKAVQMNELGGRFLETLDNHSKTFWYYYNNLLDFQITPWYLFIPAGILTGLLINNKEINKLTLFSSLMALSFFLTISISQTKLQWYDVPLYPFIAILITPFIHYIFNFLRHLEYAKETLRINILPYIFIFFICISPYKKIFTKTYLPQEYSWDHNFYQIGKFLKQAINGNHDINNHYLCYDGYYAHNLFYLNILNDNGVNISLKDWKELTKGDKVIAHQENVRIYLESHYNYDLMHTHDHVRIYKIHGPK